MTNIKEQLEQLRELQEQFKNKITELENKIAEEEKIDFSQWIGRCGSSLAIKGNKYLKNTIQCDIMYTDRLNDTYNDKLSYREGTLKDLEYGDVFILQDDLNDIELYNFNIFVGKDKDGNYVVEYLCKNKGGEAIKYHIYFKKDEDKNIIIFNRF